METRYLDFINNMYEDLITNKDIKKLEYEILDGKILVYRVKDTIRIDITRKETKAND